MEDDDNRHSVSSNNDDGLSSNDAASQDGQAVGGQALENGIFLSLTEIINILNRPQEATECIPE